MILNEFRTYFTSHFLSYDLALRLIPCREKFLCGTIATPPLGVTQTEMYHSIEHNKYLFAYILRFLIRAIPTELLRNMSKNATYPLVHERFTPLHRHMYIWVTRRFRCISICSFQISMSYSMKLRIHRDKIRKPCENR